MKRVIVFGLVSLIIISSVSAGLFFENFGDDGLSSLSGWAFKFTQLFKKINSKTPSIQPESLNKRAVSSISDIKKFSWDEPYLVDGGQYLFCRNGLMSGEELLRCDNEGKILGDYNLFCIGNGKVVGLPENIDKLKCSKRYFYINFNKIPMQSLRLLPQWVVKDSVAVSQPVIQSKPTNILNKLFSGKSVSNLGFYNKNTQNEVYLKSTISLSEWLILTKPMTVDYLIITRPMFVDKLQKFKKLKESQGYNVQILTIEDIIQHSELVNSLNYDGNDIQEMIKNFLKAMKEKNYNVKYVLLVGHPRPFVGVGDMEAQYTTELKYDWELPIKYIYFYEGWSDNHWGDGIPSDQYYASATFNWDKNGNKIYGELGNEEYTFKPDFYVGRVPVKTVEGLDNFIKRNEEWEPKELLIESAFGSSSFPITNNYINVYSNLHKVFSHMPKCANLDCGGNLDILSNSDNSDYIYINMHGQASSVMEEFILDKKNSSFLTKPVIFLASCSTGELDGFVSQDSENEDDSLSLASIILNKNDGATLILAPSRVTYDRAPVLFNLFFNSYEKIGDAWFDYKYDKSKERILNRFDLIRFLTYNILGDPSLKLVKKEHNSLSLKALDKSFDYSKVDNIKINLSNNINIPIKTRLLGGIISEKGDIPEEDKRNWLSMSDYITVPASKSIIVDYPISIPESYFKYNTDARGIMFLPDLSDKTDNVNGYGTFISLYNKIPLSCGDFDSLFMKDNNLVKFKIDTEKELDLTQIKTYFCKQGYPYNNLFYDNYCSGRGNFYLNAIKVDENGDYFFQVDIKEKPTHFYSPSRSKIQAFEINKYRLEFYYNDEYISSCDYKIHTEDDLFNFRFKHIPIGFCDGTIPEIIESKTIVVFPSGRYLIIKDIINNNVLVETAKDEIASSYKSGEKILANYPKEENYGEEALVVDYISSSYPRIRAKFLC